VYSKDLLGIKLFDQFFFKLPRFCQFIPRLNALGLLTSVSVTSPWSQPVSEGILEYELYLENLVRCTRLDWQLQLSFVAQFLTQLLILSSVAIV
jgi:hypothetical protein